MLILVVCNGDRFHINVLCFVLAPHSCGAFIFCYQTAPHLESPASSDTCDSTQTRYKQ